MLIRLLWCYVDMVQSDSCMIMAYCDSRLFHFKLNLMLIQLEYNVDRIMVPLNQASQCNHICLYGKVVIWSVVMSLVGASNEGRLWACGTLAR